MLQTFTTDQLERYPNVLERPGYANARIRLKGDAVPDVPLRVQEAAPLVLPPKTRGAFAKRNKPYAGAIVFSGSNAAKCLCTCSST